MIPLRLRGKLDALSWDAYGLINKLWLYCQDLGYPSRVHVDEVGAACARLLTKPRMDRAIAELMRPVIEHRDGTVEKLWIDLVDDHVVFPPWWVEENPPAGLWHDDVDRFVRARRRELMSPKCAGLREAIKKRDRMLCRYCGRRVNWGSNNNEDDGGTYDHIDPDGPNSLSNVVVACRRDNGRKRHRTPEQWIADDPAQGLSLLPAGTTADQASGVRARAGPKLNSSRTQAQPEFNKLGSSRARPPRVEPESNSTRTDTGSASPRPASRKRPETPGDAA